MNLIKSVLKVLKAIAPAITARNASLVLGIATVFGVVQPETATKIRNEVLAPIVVLSGGDLLGGQ